MSTSEFIKNFSHLKRGELLEEVQVELAGRIMTKRDSNRLIFYDLHSEVQMTLSSAF